MKLLLTDSGVRNPSILAALVDLLGRPIAECDALCIPTAGYGGPWAEPHGPWQFTAGKSPSPMVGLGWKSVGMLELTALPSLDHDLWVSWVRAADVLLVNGGNTMYLHRWMRDSGLADLFDSLPDTVYIGMSAGSMVLTPRVGSLFTEDDSTDDRALGLVDFSLFPHLNASDSDHHTMAAAERWAATLDNPAYATDAETALKVTDNTVEVISEGTWKLFTPPT